jgi:hypothetical protein
VLETDAFWRNLPVDARCRDSVYEWNLGFDQINGCYEKAIPAPSMAEVWRELPERYEGYGLTVVKERDGTLVGYNIDKSWFYYVRDTNPTDALIDLLIFVKENKHDHDRPKELHNS